MILNFSLMNLNFYLYLYLHQQSEMLVLVMLIVSIRGADLFSVFLTLCFVFPYIFLVAGQICLILGMYMS